MADPFSGVTAAIKVGKALVAADRAITRGSLATHFDSAARRLNENIAQVSYAVCKGLVAIGLGRDPSDDEVEDYMAGAVDDPTFPARAHQLLGAMRKTSSNERLHMLAAMLFGLPFSKTPEADRERVDVLVERLMPEDVKVLRHVNERWQRHPGESAHANCLALHYEGLRILRYPAHDEERLTAALVTGAPVVSRTAFAALVAAGCIETPGGFSSDDLTVDGVGVYSALVDVTALGTLLLDALEAVRAGSGG